MCVELLQTEKGDGREGRDSEDFRLASPLSSSETECRGPHLLLDSPLLLSPCPQSDAEFAARIFFTTVADQERSTEYQIDINAQSHQSTQTLEHLDTLGKAEAELCKTCHSSMVGYNANR